MLRRSRRRLGHGPLGAAARYGASSLAAASHRQSIIETAKQQEQRRLCDPKTGLLNRTGLEAGVTSILDRLAPGAELQVFAIDIEGFNRLLAAAGWMTGDRVIAEVGARVARTSPTGAAVARLDVDRFAVATDTRRFRRWRSSRRPSAGPARTAPTPAAPTPDPRADRSRVDEHSELVTGQHHH